MNDKTMRVMWCEKPHELEVRQVPIHEIGDDDVLVKIAYAGICPWDVRAFYGLSSSVKFPRILGHEATGYVAEVGKNVKDLEIGQPVAPDMIVKCGTCKACRTGRENICRHPTYQQYGGSYADYVRVPRRNIHTLRPGTSMKAAAFMEPLACSIRTQNMFHLYPGEVELLVGSGQIGLMQMQVARAFGARVIVSDLIDARLEKAKELGADLVVNPEKEDLKEAIQEFTQGWGVDAASVTVGSAKLIESTLSFLAPGGRLSIFAGIYPKDKGILALDGNAIHYGEFMISGTSDSTSQNMHQALEFIQNGQVNTEALISHLLPLEDLGKGLEIVKNREGLKVMLEVNGEV